MKKYIHTIGIGIALLSGGCVSQELMEPLEVVEEQGPIYIEVDLPEVEDETRMSYFWQDDPLAQERVNLCARWSLGDFIKVYEMPDAGETDPSTADPPHNTYVFKNYDDYNDQFPYPAAPVEDYYYRFVCIGGEGTSHGIFQYLGLTHATVEGTHNTDDPENILYNVLLDVIPDHKIRKWDNFDGLVIYGNPLRNYMMRHQSANDNMDHIHYGQRMQGHMCGYNFNGWFNPDDYDPDPVEENGQSKETASDPTYESGSSAATKGLLLYNTASVILKVKLGNFENEIYGGATLTLDMEGVTSGWSSATDFRNYPMSLTLGNKFDHQELLPAWCYPGTDNSTITAYVVGWPGTLKAGKKMTLTFNDNFYGKKYVWELTKDKDVEFKEGRYYIFDLTDDPIKTIETFTPTTPK